MTGFRVQKKRLMKSEFFRSMAKKERAPEIDAQEDEAVEPDEPILLRNVSLKVLGFVPKRLSELIS